MTNEPAKPSFMGGIKLYWDCLPPRAKRLVRVVILAFVGDALYGMMGPMYPHGPNHYQNMIRPPYDPHHRPPHGRTY